MSFRRTLAGIVVSGALVVAAGPAAAIPEFGLFLAIDGSGSISSSDFALQRDAYVNLLPTLVPLDGSVAIGVSQFASTVQTVNPVITINDAADLAVITNAIGGMTQLSSATAIGTAIGDAGASLLAFEAGQGAAMTLVIDVSTDGVNNTGPSASMVADMAVAMGIDRVNCLGVGSAADCGFIAGTGAFSVAAADFGGFQSALEQKLEGELPNGGPAVPEPNALVLFAIGSLVVGRFSRLRFTR